jgi:hypothetical protein
MYLLIFGKIKSEKKFFKFLEKIESNLIFL